MLATVVDVVFIYPQAREHPLNNHRNPQEKKTKKKKHFGETAESLRQEIGESDLKKKKLRCLRVF